MSSPHATRPTRAEIDLEALAFNYRSVREFVGDEVEFMAVVKANAYGHGAVECARRLEAEEVDWFAVATLEEAIELREAKVFSPILVLGGIWPGQEAALLNHSLTPTVFRLDQVKSLAGAAARQGITARVHVKIDTGMNRVGFRREEWPEAARSLSQIENIEVDGLMTHFAVADKLDETDFTNEQISSFGDALEIFLAHGHRPRYIDMANSPGAVVHPLSRAKLVRIGGLLYGLGGDVLPTGVDQPELRPVMSVRSQVALVKTVMKGESV
ncbi:MAG TPA: alanine racemase, partial [Pyrinomonadaceae bacterium]